MNRGHVTEYTPEVYRVHSLVLLGVLFLLGAQNRLSSQENDRDHHNPYVTLGSRFQFLETGDPVKDWHSVRQWTSSDGRTMTAKVEKIDAQNVHFRLANNSPVTLSISRLSEKDQSFLAEWKELSRYFNLGYRRSRNVGHTVEAGISDGAFAKEGKVHETRHFRFESDASLNAITVKDFSRMFEATYQLVRSLPLALEVDQPGNGKFLVRLFSDKDDYHRAGGPQTSAGVYLLKTREILVPFESLGLKRSGKNWRKAGEYEPSTLVHEITHAVTHQWLNYMPMWIAEGLADYVGAIPYRDGTFYLDQRDQGIYKMVATNFGGDALRFPILPPREFVYLDKDEFMQRPAQPEQPIELTAIEPYRIRLAGDESPAPTPRTPTLATTAPATKEPMIPTLPPGIRTPVNQSAIVVQRYSSSMLLIDHLIRTNQADSLRKYLFAHLNFVWDVEKYIADYNSNLDSYQDAVKQQITDFDQILQEFNRQIRNYNEVVNRKNAGEDIPLPPVPDKPEAPEPVPVPEILARPRSPGHFSRQQFRLRSVEKYLQLPQNLSL